MLRPRNMQAAAKLSNDATHFVHSQTMLHLKTTSWLLAVSALRRKWGGGGGGVMLVQAM